MDRKQSELIEGEVVLTNDEFKVSPPPVARTADRVDLRNSTPDAIRAEIERTRAAMDNTIDRLNTRLKPRHLIDDVLKYFHDSSGTQAEGSAQRTLRDAGQMAAGKLKRNPVPATLIGSGLAWLLFQNSGGAGRNARPSYDSYIEDKEDAAGFDAARAAGDLTANAHADVRDNVHEIANQASQKVDSVTNALGNLLDSAPLAFGVGALAAGLLAGLVIPGTKAEDELMGEASDTIKGAALEAGSALAGTSYEEAGASSQTSKIDRMWDR
ncbi:MAG: DUF3618 domain-containing protein [Candidatus Sumerlaeaceae bacterium]